MGSYKKFIFKIFFDLKICYGFLFKVLNVVSFDQKKDMNILYVKSAKYEQDDQKTF